MFCTVIVKQPLCVNVDVLLGHTWQLKCGCNCVVLHILVQIHFVKTMNRLALIK